MESVHRPKDLWDWVGPLYQLPPCLPDSSWTGHIPFLSLLFRLARPRTYVELGVLMGGSFLAACEAAKSFDTQTRCSGVDTWQGDQHAGFFDGEPVYRSLSAFVAQRYPACELIRATFDEAAARFEPRSIDLLHIDGLHTYEAVSHDFHTWLPKMSERGIVLFHDTEVRDYGFGVWKFWAELKAQYRHLEFQHSHGLGVLMTGPDLAPEYRRLLAYGEESPDHARWLRLLCERAAATLPDRLSATAGELPSVEQLILRQPTAGGAPPVRPPAAASPRPQPSPASPPMASPRSQPTGQAPLRRNDPCHCGSGRRFKHCHGRLG
jgi:hypothetical protein